MEIKSETQYLVPAIKIVTVRARRAITTSHDPYMYNTTYDWEEEYSNEQYGY